MKAIDITNKKFGNLTTIKYLYSWNGQKYWKFLCDCGMVKEYTSSYVKQYKVLSCGCLKKVKKNE